MKHKWLHGSVLAIGMFLLSQTASAAVIGTLRANGGPNGNVIVTATSIDFVPPPAGGDGQIQNTDNTLTYGAANTPLAIGTFGRIRDLTAPTAFPVVNFINFAPVSVAFDLAGFGPAPANTNCAALTDFQSCSAFAGSPFILTRVGGSTFVGLSVVGTARDNTSVVTNFVGGFTTQIAGLTPGQIQSIITSGGSITSAYSVELTATAIPEPGTISLLLLGGTLLVARRARKKVA